MLITRLSLVWLLCVSTTGCAVKTVDILYNGGDHPPLSGGPAVLDGDLEGLDPTDAVAVVTGDVNRYVMTNEAVVVLVDRVEQGEPADTSVGPDKQDLVRSQKHRDKQRHRREKEAFRSRGKRERNAAKRAPSIVAYKAVALERGGPAVPVLQARLFKGETTFRFQIDVRNVGGEDFTGDLVVVDRLDPRFVDTIAQPHVRGIQFNGAKIVFLAIPFPPFPVIGAVAPAWVPCAKLDQTVVPGTHGDGLVRFDLRDVTIPKARGLRFEIVARIATPNDAPVDGNGDEAAAVPGDGHLHSTPVEDQDPKATVGEAPLDLAPTPSERSQQTEAKRVAKTAVAEALSAVWAGRPSRPTREERLQSLVDEHGHLDPRPADVRLAQRLLANHQRVGPVVGLTVGGLAGWLSMGDRRTTRTESSSSLLAVQVTGYLGGPLRTPSGEGASSLMGYFAISAPAYSANHQEFSFDCGDDQGASSWQGEKETILSIELPRLGWGLTQHLARYGRNGVRVGVLLGQGVSISNAQIQRSVAECGAGYGLIGVDHQWLIWGDFHVALALHEPRGFFFSIGARVQPKLFGDVYALPIPIFDLRFGAMRYQP